MLLPSPTPALEPKLPARPGPRWRNVPIGGGGYVTGLALHPAIPDCLYFRTDVGGAFRFDPAGERWIPLLDSVAYPDRNYMGVDGIAVAPSRPGRLAIAAGQLPARTPSDVLWSDDHGATWRATGLNRAFGGNLPHRMNGECLAFHPGNPDHLLAGTRNDGLFETRDAGRSWRHVPGLPAGTTEIGIRCVLFAPERLVVAVEGAGIFVSTDEGANWTLLPGSPRHVGRMAFAGGTRLLVTSRDPGGLWAYDGAWRNLSPMADRNYHALAVDPLDPDRVLVSPLDDPSGSRFRLPIFFSADGGASWRVVAAQPDWNSAARWMKPTHFGAATSALLFDPHHPGRVYLADWYAVWRTDDIADRPVHWRALMKGHEEMFLFTLATPPKGPPLLTGMADNTGFRHVSADAARAPPRGRARGDRHRFLRGRARPNRRGLGPPVSYARIRGLRFGRSRPHLRPAANPRFERLRAHAAHRGLCFRPGPLRPPRQRRRAVRHGRRWTQLADRRRRTARSPARPHPLVLPPPAGRRSRRRREILPVS